MISRNELREIVKKDKEEKKKQIEKQKKIEEEKDRERVQTIFKEIIDELAQKIIEAAKADKYTLDVYTVDNEYTHVQELVFNNILRYLNETDFKPKIREGKKFITGSFGAEDREIYTATIYIGLHELYG